MPNHLVIIQHLLEVFVFKISENGRFLALDLGGTNFRVLLVDLKGKDQPETVSKLFLIPNIIMLGHGTMVGYFVLLLRFCSFTCHCCNNYVFLKKKFCTRFLSMASQFIGTVILMYNCKCFCNGL